MLVLCTARQGYSWGARQMRIHLVWSEMDRKDGRRTWDTRADPRVRIGTEGHGQAITARLHFCLLFKSNKHATAL